MPKNSTRLKLTRLLKKNKTIIQSVLIIFLSVFIYSLVKVNRNEPTHNPAKENINPSPIPTQTPTPTPKPLTFAQMQELYGPCTKTPVLMYHHIQSSDSAKENNQIALTVYTNRFENQMFYLAENNYLSLGMDQLINFLFNSATISAKSIILTFDDGYQDFYTDAYPILKKYNLKATVFLPSGHMDNPGYLSWDEINEMAKSGLINFANHTWSHHSTFTNYETLQKEISTADIQLEDHGLNNPKTFAYPYGSGTETAENFLNQLGYKIAFTTNYGLVLCSKNSLSLPRIRIGNTDLTSYGL